jgi:hypothetical protein
MADGVEAAWTAGTIGGQPGEHGANVDAQEIRNLLWGMPFRNSLDGETAAAFQFGARKFRSHTPLYTSSAGKMLFSS